MHAQTAQLPAGSRLRTLGGTNGLYIGGTLKTGFTTLTDAADYGLVAGREFNLFSPENTMKMRNLQPTQGTFTWTEAETAVQFAATNTADFHGHMLVGGQSLYLPTWVFNITSPTSVEGVMNTHIDTVMGHWAPATGRPAVKVWEVANESFLDSPPSPVPSDWKLGLRTDEPEFVTDPGGACSPGGGTIRNSNYDHWVATIGTGYIEKAFRRARLNDATATLMYNDFGAEGLTTKADYLYKMAQDFTNPARTGGVVPIDAVGFQCHFSGNGRTPTEIRQNFDRFSALGLDVYVTELDWLADGSTDPVTNAGILDLQARRYYNFLDAAFRVPGLAGVQVWGIGDKYTFRKNTDPCAGAIHDLPQPLPFNESYNAKPAYYAMQDALATQQRTQAAGNPNFEGATLSPWTNYGTVTLTKTAGGHAGSYSVKASGRTAAASGPGQNVTTALVANGAGRYYARAWVKVASGTASVKLTVRLQDSAQTVYKTITPVTVGTSWTLVSGWMNLTWFKTLTSATFFAETTSGSTVDYYVDDMVLGDGNLAGNGTFEGGTTGWTNNFGGTIAETNSTTGSGTYHYGDKGVQVTGRTQAYHGVAQDVLGELLASGRGTYNLGASVKLFSGAAAATGKVTLRLRDNGVDTYYSVSAAVNNASWSKIAGAVTLDWTTLQQAALYIETSSGTSSFYADDIVMRR
jgi:endo-1,4-beta-xylanase